MQGRSRPTALLVRHDQSMLTTRSHVSLAENLGPYGATKYAVRGFTEVAAKEWAQYGIRVNGALSSPRLTPHVVIIVV